jgi:hypothetical protein
MTDPRGLPRFTDAERPMPPESELLAGDEERPPLVVRLGDLWSDYIRGVNSGRDPDAPPPSPSSVPILDDMKGILQWE